MRLGEANSDVVAQLNELVIGENEGAFDFTAINECALDRLDNVGAGVAADDGMSA